MKEASASESSTARMRRRGVWKKVAAAVGESVGARGLWLWREGGMVCGVVVSARGRIVELDCGEWACLRCGETLVLRGDEKGVRVVIFESTYDCY